MADACELNLKRVHRGERRELREAKKHGCVAKAVSHLHEVVERHLWPSFNMLAATAGVGGKSSSRSSPKALTPRPPRALPVPFSYQR